MKARRTLWVLFAASAAAFPALGQAFGFDDQKAGEAPKGFTCALTGRGRAGVWTLTKDQEAKGLVLEQSDKDDTSYRFPHCVSDSVSAKDLELSVRFKPISGYVDQAAGLVWRYRDADNYYIVRANAREGNVVLYKLEAGKRTDLPLKGEGRTYGKKASVPSGVWSDLKVVARQPVRGVAERDEALRGRGHDLPGRGQGRGLDQGGLRDSLRRSQGRSAIRLMRAAIPLRIACRAPSHAPLRASLTVLGIAIGTSAVITTVAIGEGGAAQIHAQLLTLGGNALRVRLLQGNVPAQDRSVELTP